MEHAILSPASFPQLCTLHGLCTAPYAYLIIEPQLDIEPAQQQIDIHAIRLIIKSLGTILGTWNVDTLAKIS